MTDVLSLTPSAVAQDIPFLKATGFFFATFVLEDVAAVGAGLLLATGGISWPAAFAACFLGIWLGDAGLYALARFAGRGWFERSSLRRFAPRVANSERWFAERGIPILIFSRLIPSARLPTYLAAGFLRVPLPRFLLITGVASFTWTWVVLMLAKAFGAQLANWLSAFKHAGLLLMAIAIIFFSLQLFRRGVASFDFRLTSATRRLTIRLQRWQRWEFWPAWMFYPPVALYYLWLSIKYRGLTVPTAANPGIFSGGIIGESKIAILQRLMDSRPEFTADGELLAGSTPQERLVSIRGICQRLQIQYPFVLKPDVGQRGVGVKLIRSEDQAVAYLNQTSAPLLLQRYAAGPHEAGIFYYRCPHEPHGHVFAITEKIFPALTGDGRSSISDLIWADPRARLMAAKYLERFNGRDGEILPSGESLRLVEAGNHAQGCIFQEGMHLCTPELIKRIDSVSRSITGFYIGRYDIRYASEEELRAGRNFQIIELNGAASEATSIYDARNSLFDAYRTLFRQWDLVFAIGAANRRRGAKSTPLKLLIQKWRQYSRVAASYPIAD